MSIGSYDYKKFPALFVMLIVLSFLSGAVMDRPLAELFFSNNISSRYVDRLEILQRWPPVGAIVVYGDSHVERMPWREIDRVGTIANFGIGGENINRVADRISNSGEKRIVLIVGSNDAIAGTEFETIRSALGSILSRPDREVLLFEVFPVNGRYKKYSERIRQINEIYRELCRGNCSYVETWDILSVNGHLDSQLSNDGLHLNANGYEELLKIIERQKWPLPPTMELN